jgi:periplasmic protein TonB
MLWIAASFAMAAPADTVPAKPISTMPHIIAGQIGESDYPRKARREDLTGETRAMLRVSRAGRVTRCSISRSSGHAILDARVCELALTRLRLAPARDTEGKPTEMDVVLPVLWKLEDSPKPAG